ncbi:hypothetical protein [Aurantibacter sp.]|uniref:hypothetical protein n=1 Tax=Aurantibacter sp. TaxID=2807103 RepID=UPI003264CC43
MKITTADIQFIDNYLKNTDIQYIDVRMEMLDHIATAIENDMHENNRSFYVAFKEYMVYNKKQLEKDYERLRKDLQKKSFGILGRKMLTPPFLALFITLFVLLYYWSQFFEVTFPYSYVIWGSLIFSLLFYLLGTLPKRKYRISSLEMLVFPIGLGAHFANLCFNFSNTDSIYLSRWLIVPMLLISFFLCANAAFLVLFFEKRKEVKQKFI